jgi:hypothetical protein
MVTIHVRFVAALVAAFWLCPQLLAQSPTPSRPNFSGTWVPTDPEASDARFNVGLSRIPGSARLTIEQAADRFTLSITIPDDRLDAAFANGRFEQTVIYRVYDAWRSGGAGAGPPKVPPKVLTRTAWVDDRLVIPNASPGLARPVTMTFSMAGERLRIETRFDADVTSASTITDLFTKMK